MADEKIAIIGGAGMLGTDLASQCSDRRLNFEVFDLPDFDITNDRQLSSVVETSDIIINCAAYTNVEKAESEPDLAFKINAEAVGHLGDFAKTAGKYVFHISTDFVFNGKSDRPYIETDETNPISTYGASKLVGEKALAESRCSYCIMRAQWTYGRAGNNFVTKLLTLTQQRKELKVVDDQTGSPTATTEVAKAICSLLQKRPQGIYHFANSGYVSRYDIAKFIFEKLNVSVDLIACKTADFPSAAKRPLNSRFDCSKISDLLPEPIEPWQKPLTRFLETSEFCQGLIKKGPK